MFGKVKQVRRKSQSVPDLTTSSRGVVSVLLDQVLGRAWERVMGKMNKLCHHCHRLLSNPDHKGIGSGVNLCSLDHYELCPGGRETEKGWTGCPPSEAEESELESNSESEGLDGSQAGSGGSLPATLVSSPNQEDNINGINRELKMKLDPKAVENALKDAAARAESVVLDTVVIEDTDDEEDRYLLDEIEKLQIEVEKQQKAKSEADSLAKKEQKRLRREKLEKRKAELLHQSKTLHQSAQGLPVSKEVTKDGGGKTLKMKAAELAAKQQIKDANKNNKDVAGLTIAGIRALPGMTPEVEQWMTKLTAAIPSLSKTPTAPVTSGVSFQPPGVFSGQQKTSAQAVDQRGDDSEAFDMDFVFSATRGKLVRVVHDSPGSRDHALTRLLLNRDHLREYLL